MYTNIDQISNKVDELEIFLHKEDIDLAAIVETQPKTKEKVDIPVIKGYNSEDDPSGRGVCLIVKQNLEVIRYEDIENIFKPSLFAKIILSKDKFFNIGVQYRSPSSDNETNNKLNSQINYACKKLNSDNNKLILLGDYNYPEINWSNETCNTNADHKAAIFLNTLQENFLTQKVVENTHFMPNCKPSLIDLIIVKNPDLVSNINDMAPLGSSHHVVLLFETEIKHDPPKQQTTSKYQLNKGDFPKMREFIKDIDWDKLLSNEEDIDKWWEKISSVIENAMFKFIPKAKNNSFTSKRSIPIPDTLHNKIKLKRTAFKNFKKYPTKANRDAYARARNQVKWGMRIAKRNKEREISKNIKANPKKFYNYVNSKIKGNAGISNLIDKEGNLTESVKDKCEVLNDFFSSVFVQENESFIPKLQDKEVKQNLTYMSRS